MNWTGRKLPRQLQEIVLKMGENVNLDNVQVTSITRDIFGIRTYRVTVDGFDYLLTSSGGISGGGTNSNKIPSTLQEKKFLGLGDQIKLLSNQIRSSEFWWKYIRGSQIRILSPYSTQQADRVYEELRMPGMTIDDADAVISVWRILGRYVHNYSQQGDIIEHVIKNPNRLFISKQFKQWIDRLQRLGITDIDVVHCHLVDALKLLASGDGKGIEILEFMYSLPRRFE